MCHMSHVRCQVSGVTCHMILFVQMSAKVCNYMEIKKIHLEVVTLGTTLIVTGVTVDRNKDVFKTLQGVELAKDII